MKTLFHAARSVRFALVAGALFLGFGQGDAQASVSFTADTFAGYLVTPDLIAATNHSTMKILIVNNTSSDVSANLCLGTQAQFQQSICGKQLAYSKNGPGLALVDATMLNGMVLYVLKGPAGTDVNFTLTFE